ncbi:MAG: hypothetical protein ACRYF4_14405 [Janthinobacterium lividum]
MKRVFLGTTIVTLALLSGAALAQTAQTETPAAASSKDQQKSLKKQEDASKEAAKSDKAQRKALKQQDKAAKASEKAKQ